MKLSEAWNARLKLRAEGDKLYAEGCKLRAKGCKLWLESVNLLDKGDKLWVEAIIEAYGNISLEWKYSGDNRADCHLENGEVYKADVLAKLPPKAKI